MKIVPVDYLVSKHTAFDSLHDMLHTRSSYRPAFYCDTNCNLEETQELVIIADEYDRIMKDNGDPRRCRRY